MACEQRWHRVGEALLGVRVSVDQGQVIVAALDELACGRDLVNASAEEWCEVLARAETHLVEQAEDFGPRSWSGVSSRTPSAGPGGVRRGGVQHLGDGTALIRARVPEAVAPRLTTILEAFTNPRRETGGPAEADGRRVPYERRLGEAFCCLLESLDPARLPLPGGDATTLVITMDLAALTAGLGTATLPDGAPMTAGKARRLACTAGLVPDGARHSRSGTVSAAPTGARSPRRGARPTTSPLGQRVGRPTWRTGCWSAVITTT